MFNGYIFKLFLASHVRMTTEQTLGFETKQTLPSSMTYQYVHIRYQVENEEDHI